MRRRLDRLSINTPAVLLNNAGAGIEATVNKAAAGNDAAFAFKTGFSARALIGLLGSDDFSFKVSPDGSTYHRRDPHRPDLGPGRAAEAGDLAGSEQRAGGAGVRQAGALRQDPCRPALARRHAADRARLLAAAAPRAGALRRTGCRRPAPPSPPTGMSNSTVGTVSTPGSRGHLARDQHAPLAADLGGDGRLGRRTSGAASSPAGAAALPGSAAGPFVTRISLATLQATGMVFFGLYGSTAALATTLTLSATVSCVGIGFQRGSGKIMPGAPALAPNSRMPKHLSLLTGTLLTVLLLSACSPQRSD